MASYNTPGTPMVGQGAVFYEDASGNPVPVTVATPLPVTGGTGSSGGGTVDVSDRAARVVGVVSAGTAASPVLAAADGTDASAAVPPAGAAGIRGWLSGIYATLQSTLRTRISDGTGATLATVALLHTTDNTPPPTGGSILTAGSAQLRNLLGNLDNQRETGSDGVSAIGIASGSAQFAMAFRTSVATSIAAGATTVTPAAMSGSVQGVPWSVQVGSVLTTSDAGQSESVLVTAVTATTFSALFLRSHAAGVILVGFVYNQERDAAGELDGATGAGTAVAAGYEYNGGHPDGIHNYDRDRNLHAKGHVALTLGASTTVGQSTITAPSSPAGLEPGEMITLSTANLATPEVAYVASNYVLGSTTIPLQAPLATAGNTILHYETYMANGPGLNGMLPFGLGIEEDVVYDAATGLFFLERSATADAASGQNLPLIAPGAYNGATFDRLRSATGVGTSNAGYALAVTTGVGVLASINAASAPVNGTALSLVTARSLLSLQVDVTTTTAGASGAHALALQGSLDNVNWYPLATASLASSSTSAADSSNHAMVAATGTVPVLYARAVWTAIPLTWAGTLSARVTASG